MFIMDILAVWQDYSEWGGVYEDAFWDINQIFTYFVNINKTIIFVSDNNIKINVY